MNIQEALGIANALKNHYRAFQKLDEFVEWVAGKEASISDLRLVAEKITGEIDILKETKEEYLKELQGIFLNIQEQNRVLTDAQKTTKDELVKLAEGTEKAVAEYKKIRIDLEERFRFQADAYSTELDELKSKVLAEEQKLTSIRTEMQKLFTRVTE